MVPSVQSSRGIDVSVVIPTHNGRARIGDVLEALGDQAIAADRFEIVVVDNNSTDGTARAVESSKLWIAMKANGVGVRVIHEPMPGLTLARIRGVQEARAESVVFLDDDNVPCREYLIAGAGAMRDPRVGLLVSRVKGRFEQAPPPAILRRQHLLAINYMLGDRAIEWPSQDSFAPTLGAGMWVRRNAFLAAVPWKEPERLLGDRSGTSLRCGGDIEIGMLIARGGYTRMYRPELLIDHVIPASRMRTGYFCRLIVAIIRSQATLDAVYIRPRTRMAFFMHSINFVAMCVISPILLLRRDGWREMCFVVAARLAHMLGRYRT